MKTNKRFFKRNSRFLTATGQSNENQNDTEMSVQYLDEEHEVDKMPPMMAPFQKGVHVEENNIYIYSPIGDLESLEINKALRKLDRDLQILRLQNEMTFDVKLPDYPIKIHIQSPGGAAFSAFSIVDTMKTCKSPIYTYVMGHAASAATLISCAGTKGHRYATKNSFMLFHQQRLMFGGTFSNFKDEAETQEQLYKQLQDFYMENSKMEEKDLDDLLKRELYLPASKCIEYGFIDKIM